jgi:hypothetical protein
MWHVLEQAKRKMPAAPAESDFRNLWRRGAAKDFLVERFGFFVYFPGFQNQT